MIKKDYVNRCNNLYLRRKKNNFFEKKITIFAIFILVTLIIIVGVYLITNKKKSQKFLFKESIFKEQVLPPKPEDRWRYIKELENNKSGFFMQEENFSLTNNNKSKNTNKKTLWIVQCGSFKNAEQAETVRLKLFLDGFNSHITMHKGWNRVVIGPIKKNNIDNTINSLKIAGYTNCILLTNGG